MLLWLVLRLVCVVFSAALPSPPSSSFSENLIIRPLKNGNMLLDISFHMEYNLRKRCARRPYTYTNGKQTTHHSMSCVSQNSGAPLELAQLYTLLPAQVTQHKHQLAMSPSPAGVIGTTNPIITACPLLLHYCISYYYCYYYPTVL